MIFISHKNDPDHEAAIRIAQMLQANGITCWIAPESIPKGMDHAVEITRAINTCEIFLLILTENTCESDYVRLELNFAIDHKKKIIPVMIGSFELDDVLHYLIGNTKQIMVFDFSDEACSDLIEQCKTGERIVSMEISKNPRRTVNLIKGDYDDNMEHHICTYPDELKHTVFAMGVDCSSNLHLSTTGGIIKSVVQYLNRAYGVTVDEIQQRIDLAKMEQLHHPDANQELQFKDILLVEVPIKLPHFQPERTERVKLLLIANTRKAENWNGNVDKVVGVDSREIILKIFEKCAQIGPKAKHLFIGAMGTNGTAFPYEVVTAEILNCFVYAKRKSKDSNSVCFPLHLWYSVRQSDMERWGLSSDEVLTYISTVVSFFKDDRKRQI